MSNQEKAGEVVGMLTIEMKVEAIVERVLQIRSGENIFKLAKNPTTLGMQKYMAEAAALSDGSNMIIEGTTNRDLGNIRAMIKRMKRDNPLMSVLYLDYLQLIRSSNPKMQTDEVGTITESSGVMMDLAKDLDLAIVQLAQCNRDSDGGVPLMKHLKGSSAIEQDSGTVILVHRDLQAQLACGNNERELAVLDADLIVCKNRSGRTSTANVKFNALTTEFYSDANDYGRTNDL